MHTGHTSNSNLKTWRLNVSKVRYRHARIGPYGYDVRFIIQPHSHAVHPGEPMLFARDIAAIDNIFSSANALLRGVPGDAQSNASCHVRYQPNRSAQYVTVTVGAALIRVGDRRDTHPHAFAISAWLQAQDWDNEAPEYQTEGDQA